jgi:hypothetical protein
MTVPDADFSVARIDAAQTFTGVNTFVTAGTGTGAPIYVSPTSNAVADVFTGRNLSTGTSAITRFALGNNLTPTGFTITQYGGNHATNANKVQINNEFTSSISISANGGTDNIILASNGNLTLETGNLVFGTSAKGINTSAANPFTFNINGSERGRVTAGGYTKFTSDGSYYNSTGTYHEFYQSADAWGAIVTAANSSQTNTGFRVFCARNTTNNTYYAIDYYNTIGDNVRFRVADSGNVTNVNGSYGTISDLKMKTDIVDAGSQWDDIKAIRFRKFKMRDDPDQIVQLGVVAQELEQTSPGLIEEHIDRDEENNDLGTTTKSVKTSVLLMKAAKALQEAMARIEVLETQVAELKTK